MPKGTGGVGDEIHDQLIKDATEFNIFAEGQQQPLFEQINRWWKLYLAQREDKRKEHEKWRANFSAPLPFRSIETIVATECDILNSSDPIIQAEGVDQRDQESALAIEQQLDYILRRNRWGRTQEILLRSRAIQGIVIPKLTWVNRSVPVTFYPRASDVNDWKQRVKEAEVAVGLPAPLDPDEYEVWREMVEAQTKIKVPAIPIPGRQQVLDYSGPWINQTPIWHLRYDPLVQEIDDHDIIIHRSVKPLKWLEDRKDLYDQKQVEQALQGWDGSRLEEFERQQAAMMGVAASQITDDPIYRKSVELWEVWRPRTDTPFQLILNRKAIINKDPSTSPYWHGQYPFIPLRGTPIQGHFHGLSDLQQPEKLFYESDAVRNNRMDALMMAILPVFGKRKDVGMTEIQRKLAPGAILDLSSTDAIKQLTQINPAFAQAIQEQGAIESDIDEATGAVPQLRGAPSQIGRVSATESERRFSQAQVRTKQRAVRTEEELQRMVKQMLFLSYQFYSPEDRKHMGSGQDPLPTIPRDTFLAALEMDFRFRGASKALNNDMVVQQLSNFATTFGPSQLLAPQEMREVMRRILEAARIKGIDQIVQPQVTASMMQAAQMQQEADAQAQTQGEPPATVDGAAAEQLVNEADAGVPPEPSPEEMMPQEA